MAITKIQYQSSCPYGHEEIDYVDLQHRKYVYCYECKKKYINEQQGKDVFEYNVFGSPNQKIGQFASQTKLGEWS